MLADVNGDGVVNGFDIDAFVDALTGEASFMSRAGVRAAVLDALE
jgi:hypothetical protein